MSSEAIQSFLAVITTEIDSNLRTLFREKRGDFIAKKRLFIFLVEKLVDLACIKRESHFGQQWICSAEIRPLDCSFHVKTKYFSYQQENRR